MKVSSRRNIVWLKLMRGTLAVIVIMFAVRLMVVPTAGIPSWGTWMVLDGQTPAWKEIHQIMESKPGKQLVIIRYRPDNFWWNDWVSNGYDIPAQQLLQPILFPNPWLAARSRCPDSAPTEDFRGSADTTASRFNEFRSTRSWANADANFSLSSIYARMKIIHPLPGRGEWLQ